MYENDDYIESILIPNGENSGSDDSEEDNSMDDENVKNNDDDDDDEDEDDNQERDHNMLYSISSFQKVLDNYHSSQRKLDEHHTYKWVNGEFTYDETLSNVILLSEVVKQRIMSRSLTDLFEDYISTEFKQQIIDSTVAHGYDLSPIRLDVFLGINIFTSFNSRTSQRDYWSTDPLLRADIVCSAMGRKEFETIKKNIKFWRPGDENNKDRIWRVRKLLDLFNESCKKYGFFSTALSVDEMMIKYFGRTILKQFIKSKPIRFGIKSWALCSSSGYLFHSDIYCGKNAHNEFLPNCPQGSRVVMQMLQPLLSATIPRKRTQYHVCFDNLFCSPDLLVHLKKQNIKATGTVRKDRIKESNDIDTKAARGTYTVKHDKNSGVNFITVVDSKQVSILSTAAGVTPLSTVNRWSKEHKEKQAIPFPAAFTSYNKFMGGVDTHDQRCNSVAIIVRSKKWTWPILMRFLQQAMTNVAVLRNAASDGKIKTSAKEVAMSIARDYLAKAHETAVPKDSHKTEVKEKRGYCAGKKCSLRTQKYCIICKVFLCKNCFSETHKL